MLSRRLIVQREARAIAGFIVVNAAAIHRERAGFGIAARDAHAAAVACIAAVDVRAVVEGEVRRIGRVEDAAIRRTTCVTRYLAFDGQRRPFAAYVDHAFMRNGEIGSCGDRSVAGQGDLPSAVDDERFGNRHRAFDADDGGSAGVRDGVEQFLLRLHDHFPLRKRRREEGKDQQQAQAQGQELARQGWMFHGRCTSLCGLRGCSAKQGIFWLYYRTAGKEMQFCSQL